MSMMLSPACCMGVLWRNTGPWKGDFGCLWLSLFLGIAGKKMEKGNKKNISWVISISQGALWKSSLSSVLWGGHPLTEALELMVCVQKPHTDCWPWQCQAGRAGCWCLWLLFGPFLALRCSCPEEAGTPQHPTHPLQPWCEWKCSVTESSSHCFPFWV